MIVIIPCWRRPAHLAALLTTIWQAYYYDGNRYMFSVDRGHDPEILDVIREWRCRRRRLEVSVTIREHDFKGTACNILSAYDEARQLAEKTGDNQIALLEEDLLVARDIFDFYYEAWHAAERPAAISACANQNMPGPLIGDAAPERLLYKHDSYQSIGIAHSVDFVTRICEHATPAYYSNQTDYCRRELFGCGVPNWHASQDGLIARVLRRSHLATIYPIIPRAFHAGWHGLNRAVGRPLDLPWREAAEKILTMTADQMNELADPSFRDIAPCNLIRDPVPLKLV